MVLSTIVPFSGGNINIDSIDSADRIESPESVELLNSARIAGNKSRWKKFCPTATQARKLEVSQ